MEGVIVMRRLISLVALVGMIAMLSTGVAFGKANGTDRPLKGRSVSTTTIDIATGAGTSDGTSQLSHCGRTTFHNDFTFALTGPDTFTLVGTDTEVCANGDQLFSTFTITGTLSTGEFTGVFTGTGGTGRFADASGTFTIAGQSTIVSMVGTIITSRDTNTIDGLISY
jgi:hypothetical protein